MKKFPDLSEAGGEDRAASTHGQQKSVRNDVSSLRDRNQDRLAPFPKGEEENALMPQQQPLQPLAAPSRLPQRAESTN